VSLAEDIQLPAIEVNALVLLIRVSARDIKTSVEKAGAGYNYGHEAT
jgi:hypothetical protein